MNADDLKQQLLDWTVRNSGAEQRTYLGMSSISECSLELYRRMLEPRQWTMSQHLYCYNGYLFERDLKARLAGLGLYAPGSERELVATFDARFIGHTDGALVTGEMLEIKSTHQEKLDRIVSEGRIPMANFEQVQTYMRHGNYYRAFVVYVARDSGNLHVFEMRLVLAVADRLDIKAKRILRAVDEQRPPKCECRRCKIPAAFEPME